MMTDYEKTVAEFSWDAPERFNFARDVVDKWATQNPQQLALFWVDDNGNGVLERPGHDGGHDQRPVVHNGRPGLCR